MQPQEDPTIKPLPDLRLELRLFRGPDEPSGAPTFNLFDPVKSKYYKISWEQSLLFEFVRSGMSAVDLSKQINKNTTIHIEPAEVLSFYRYLAHFGLLKMAKSSDTLLEEVQKGKMNPFMWLILHYLYIRVPLINPDRFLTRTLPFVKPLASKGAYFIYGLISLIGIGLLIPRFDEYVATFPYFFNLEGILFFSLGFILVKFVHEFSHAYTAKYYGIYVPTMGVVFLVLFPALYTDVTHGWQLKDRKARFAISVAGVVSELVMAGLATFGWALASPGRLQGFFFLTSSSSILTSLFINLNPAMRFDGYYLLSDLWGIDNLQTRAFAMTRWKLRQFFFGFKDPPPEAGLSERRIRGMVVYSVYTWIYRLFLYTAIALFVYFKFTKTLGVMLFVIEIYVFFIWPVVSEVKELAKLRAHFTKNPRILTTAILTTLLLLYFVLPLPHTVYFSGVTAPEEEQLIYAPLPGQVEKIFVERGQKVEEGQTLATLTSYPLQNEILQVEADYKITDAQARVIQVAEELRPLLAQKRSERESISERMKGLQAQSGTLTLKSKVSGLLAQWDEQLREGLFVKKDQVFGRIVSPEGAKVIFFVPEREIDSVSLGKRFDFTLHDPRESLSGTVTKIRPFGAGRLKYPILSSDYGGPFATKREENGALTLLDSYYEVEGHLEETKTSAGPVRWEQSGEVSMTGRWRSHAGELWKTLLGIFTRESGT